MDGWTSPFQDDFLGVTAHWINDDWMPKEILIGFEPLTGCHTAENLVESLVKVLDRFHLIDRLQAITTDNASNMTKMMRLLQQYIKDGGW